MTKKFMGFRFDPELYKKFKELAKKNSLMVTEAFERFMGACVQIGAIKFPEPAANVEDAEAEARIFLEWLRKGDFWVSLGGEDQTSTRGRLLELFPRIKNEALREEVEKELKKRK